MMDLVFAKGEKIVAQGENVGYHNKVTTILSFSHSVVYFIKERNRHFSNILFVVCKCFQLGYFKEFFDW